jgi:hypothetical protein
MATKTSATPIVHAAALYRPLRRASRMARTSGASVIAVGAVLIAGQVIWTLSTWPCGLVLVLLGASECRASRGLLRADPAAPRLLALHQVAVFATVLLYAVAQSWVTEDVSADMRGGLAAAVLVSAGTQAIVVTYYLSRRRLLARFRDATDSWVHRLMTLETT